MQTLAKLSADSLETRLAEARADSAEFPVALANHAPMILVALDRLGADEARLGDYFVAYRDHNGLVPTPPLVAPIRRDSWTEAFGDRAREGDYRAFFMREVSRLGVRDAVGAYLPTLLPGLAGSALHPLMRLAYGVLREDPAEVGTALGYWSACYLPLPQGGGEPITDDPAEVLAKVCGLRELRDLPTYDHLWYGIRAVGEVEAFAPVIDWLRIDERSLARVAATSLAVFAATMDFAALHAVTGTHWVRLISAVFPDPRLLRRFWQAVAALVPAIGFPDLPSPEAIEAMRQAPCPDWPEIKARAIASSDEHDISLVFSASEEEKIYGDRLYRVVAARRLGLIA